MKLAVSGTYSTGKTTTTIALHYLTGIQITRARTMREILPEVFPGKLLEECDPFQLFELGLRRFHERSIFEASCGDSFLSDGSSLHEWVYGKSRIKWGINPNENLLFGYLKKITTYPVRSVFEKMTDSFGIVVKQHAKKTYQEFIHLPVEFPLERDSHRPVSEKFRKQSDLYLLQTLNELGIKYNVFGGSIKERLDKICSIYKLKQIMPVENAIELAQKEIKKVNDLALETKYNTGSL